MKVIGMIGGLSPVSTVFYYNALNEGANKRLGDLHNAKILLSSVDFGEFVALKQKDDWDTQADLLVAAAQNLEKGGADFIILATNTMHKMADQIEKSISIPFLHIADATAQKITESGLDKISLLGTRYTMTQDFYKDRLASHGIHTLVPDEAGQDFVNDVIYEEICKGIVKPQSQQGYSDVIQDLTKKGAQGVIYGCTEIGELMGGKDVGVPVFDTAAIHVNAALEKAFE